MAHPHFSAADVRLFRRDAVLGQLVNQIPVLRSNLVRARQRFERVNRQAFAFGGRATQRQRNEAYIELIAARDALVALINQILARGGYVNPGIVRMTRDCTMPPNRTPPNFWRY